MAFAGWKLGGYRLALLFGGSVVLLGGGAVLVRRPDRDGDGRRARAAAGRGARRCTARSSARRRGPASCARGSTCSRTAYPRALSAGRGAQGGAALAVSTGLLGVATPAELEGIVAHELAHLRHRDVLVQTIAVIARRRRRRRVAPRRLAPARAPVRARAARGVVRASAALAEARVRGRPLRRRALRFAARACRRAAPAGERHGARRVSGEPCDRAALRHESVRRRGPRGAVRRRIRRSASACAGCASSIPTGARSCARRELAPARTTKGPVSGALVEEMGGVLLSREIALRVPSALAGLTSLFGMGRGVSPPL